MNADTWVMLVGFAVLLVVSIGTGIYNDIKRGPKR